MIYVKCQPKDEQVSFEVEISAAANAGITQFGFVPAGGILLDSAILYSTNPQPAHMTSAALGCDVTTLITAAQASFANLSAEGDQVANETNEGFYFVSGNDFFLDLQGTGTDVVNFHVVLTYRPLQTGQRITP